MTNDDKIKLITEHMVQIMSVLNMPYNESTKGTPERIAKMYVNEVFRNINNETIEELNKSIKVFPNDFGCYELVILKDIPFYSMCEHHFMPFSGKITVAYIPKQSVIGLSKIPRIVKYFSKKPQLQERLVNEIADYLYNILDCEAVYVLANNTVHTCVTARGIETYCDTDTLACRGAFAQTYKDDFYKRLRGV